MEEEEKARPETPRDLHVARRSDIDEVMRALATWGNQLTSLG